MKVSSSERYRNAPRLGMLRTDDPVVIQADALVRRDVRHYVHLVPDARSGRRAARNESEKVMAVYYPLHLQERAARLLKQRTTEAQKLKVSAARRIAELIAAAPVLIPIKVASYPQPQGSAPKPDVK